MLEMKDGIKTHSMADGFVSFIISHSDITKVVLYGYRVRRRQGF
jgi:hypothetical protein